MELIVKYKNRKLYSSTQSKYVTLPDIRDMLSEGKKIKVTDKKTGTDVTAHTMMRALATFSEVSELTNFFNANK